MNITLCFRRVAASLGAVFGIMFISAAYAQNIKIAMVGPFTGALTQYGEMIKEGVLTAVERANAAGGFKGRQFEIVQIDDACEPKQAPIAANRVINDHISFVVGHACSGPSIAVADIYENERVVMVSPSAISSALTDNKHYQYIFRTIGREDQQGPDAAQYIAQHLKPKKVAVLHDKQSYGQGVATSVKKTLEKQGIKTVFFEGINAGDTDYSAIITKLKSANIDLVYYGGYHTEMGLLLRQAAEQELHARFMGPEGVGNPDINAIAGPAVEGMLLTQPADFSLQPANAQIVKSFQSKNRNAAGPFQLSAYTAAQVLIDAIKLSESTDPEKIAQYLHAHIFDTPIGKVSWNQQGDLNHFKFDVFIWHADGSKSRAE